MRGQEKNTKTLTLTGNVYLKYEDEEELSHPQTGDLKFYLQSDTLPGRRSKGVYACGDAGYFRADIFDGWEWQILNLYDFLEQKEHHFRKTEYPIDTYHLCKPLLEAHKGTVVYRGYRGGHYSTYLHESAPFKGRKGQKSLSKNKNLED